MYEDIVNFSGDGSRPFQILMAGISYCDGSYEIVRPNSPIYCFEYIMDGFGYVTQDQESFVAEKGDVYILSAGRDHHYYSDSAQPWTKVWFNIYGEFIGKTLESYQLQHTPHIMDCPVSELFFRFLDTVRSARPRDVITDECTHIFLSIVQAIARRMSQNMPADSIARRLKREIDELDGYHVTLDELSKRLFCSKSPAIRVFREEYRITPYQYLMQKKLADAEALLKNTNLPVSKIAEKLAFCDNHYFSSFFKEHTGVTPIAYRKAR